MSDDKKPEKAFLDEKTGLLHDSDCPRTKKEFGQEGGGECPGETLVKEILTMVREAIPYQADDGCTPRAKYAKHSGPAKVSSPAYRDGYDRIFGTRPTVGKA
jgi:hypothetical protein